MKSPEVPAWVDTLAHQLKKSSRARYTMPYQLVSRPPARMARGSVVELPAPTHEPAGPRPRRAGSMPVPVPETHVPLPARLPERPPTPLLRGPMLPGSAGFGDRFGIEPPARRVGAGRVFVLASVAILATATTYASVRLWRDAHRAPIAPQPADVAMLDEGRLELAPDRRTVHRVGRIEWSTIAPAAIDSLQITGPFVLGRTTSSLIAIELERGTPRFAWELPAGERWRRSAAAVVDSCFAISTQRGSDGVLRCLDPDTGTTRWTATIAGGVECDETPIAIAGAYVQQCRGWTAVIDAKTGAVATEAGGLALLRRAPATLLREQAGRLTVAGYQDTRGHRFAAGSPLRSTVDAPTSAVERNQRVIVRGNTASPSIATLIPKSGPTIAVTVPELQLADDARFVTECEIGETPRFQLVELAPRAGNTFDPEAAQQRVLALLDLDTGRVTWTSRRVVLSRRADGEPTAICRHGHYFVPVGAGVWVVDASTGQTRGTLAIDRDAVALSPTQVGAEVLAIRTTHGWTDVRWREDGKSGADVVERELGRLP